MSSTAQAALARISDRSDRQLGLERSNYNARADARAMRALDDAKRPALGMALAFVAMQWGLVTCLASACGAL